MKTIQPREINDICVSIPGSKSISHRMMICASLSGGESKIHNVLNSEDLSLTIGALKNFGSNISQIDNNAYIVNGFAGNPVAFNSSIYLGNSGTSMRLLAGIAALGDSPYVLTGDQRMCQRPMNELLDALQMIGISAISENTTGTPPVTIHGRSREGGPVLLDCSKSSQYLSALLMIGPFFNNGLIINLPERPVSLPYIDLTINIMKQFNVDVQKLNDTKYLVKEHQKYTPGEFFVEPDLSNAGYFWSAGAITKKNISVDNISLNSLQGDLKLIYHFEKMGCKISHSDNSIGVCGADLKGIDVDMSDTPDAVPALAVTAAFASGVTYIRNIKHLREKECDRIDAVSSQLLKMNIKVEQGEDWMKIYGGTPKGAFIETFNDHRIAMAFSIAGLLVPGVEIENESCVGKSFPGYWNIFDLL